MNRAELDVEKLVSMITSGELRLPELQRRYVWQGPRVRDLFDSLYGWDNQRALTTLSQYYSTGSLANSDLSIGPPSSTNRIWSKQWIPS